MATSGPPLKTDQMLIATFVISGILAIVLIVSLLLAKMVKKRTLTQQGFHGINFAYFVQSTILCLICNKGLLIMKTKTARNTCLFAVILVSSFARILQYLRRTLPPAYTEFKIRCGTPASSSILQLCILHVVIFQRASVF